MESIERYNQELNRWMKDVKKDVPTKYANFPSYENWLEQKLADSEKRESDLRAHILSRGHRSGCKMLGDGNCSCGFLGLSGAFKKKPEVRE